MLWTKADSRNQLLSDLASLASRWDLPEKGEKDLSVVATAVKKRLESDTDWLLILDNADTLSWLPQFKYLPRGGTLLFTTRASATGTLAERVEISKMHREKGALFLLRRAKIIAREADLSAATPQEQTLAQEISREVGDLPLALDQAGAYIEETSSSLSEYLDYYRSEGAESRAKRGEVVDDHESVTVTFSLAFQKVADENQAAADLIRFCAFLAPDAIPEEIIPSLWLPHSRANLFSPLKAMAKRIRGVKRQTATPPTHKLVGAVKEASRFSLIRRNPINRTIDQHRLVQEVVKDEMDEQSRRIWAERVVLALSQAFPSPEYKNWSQCDRLLPHAETAANLVERYKLKSQAAGRLLNGTAYYLFERARYVEAGPLFQRSLTIREKVLGPEHPDVATSLNNLAALYRAQGKYEEAEPLYQRSLTILEKVLGPEHPNVATSLNNLALLYDAQGKYEEAEPLYQRSLTIREKVLGPEHPDVATSLNNLALLYDAQGKYEEAEPLFQRSLTIREKVLGPEHPDVATSLNNLAALYRAQGKYEEAEPLYQRSLTIREKVLGPEHPDVATSLNNLAALYDAQGKYEEAEPLYQRSLTIREKVLGPEHPDVANSLNNLAALYDAQGKYEEAEPLYQRSLTIREKVLGPEHPDVANSLNNLAALYDAQGKYEEAEPLYQRSLTIREKVLGPEHADVATSLENYAALLQKTKRNSEAQRFENRAKAIRSAVDTA